MLVKNGYTLFLEKKLLNRYDKLDLRHSYIEARLKGEIHTPLE